MSWLYEHRDQLDGYRLFAEIAYRFRPQVLPDDRDDIEQDIVLKLKYEADRHTQITPGFLYAVARNVVRGYWCQKYREWEKVSHFYSNGDKGEMVFGSWKIIGDSPEDIDAKLDRRALLKALPERVVKLGLKKMEHNEPLSEVERRCLYSFRHSKRGVALRELA